MNTDIDFVQTEMHTHRNEPIFFNDFKKTNSGLMTPASSRELSHAELINQMHRTTTNKLPLSPIQTDMLQTERVVPKSIRVRSKDKVVKSLP